MNIASVIIVAVIVILFIGAVRTAKKKRVISKCNGNCSACSLKCNKE